MILSNSSREEDKAHASRLGAVGYYVKANLSLRTLGDEVSARRTPGDPRRREGDLVTTRTGRAATDATLVAARLAALSDDTGMTVAELQDLWLSETADRLELAVNSLLAGDLSDPGRLVHGAAGTTGICGAAASRMT